MGTLKKKEKVRPLWDKAELGWIEPVKEKGKLKWDVKLSKDSGFLCERHEDAQIMSMLVRIMQKLGMKEDIDYFRREKK